MKGSKHRSFCRLLIAAVALLFWVLSGQTAEAVDNLQSAGDALAVLLPAAAGITILALKDWEGAEQLVKSATLTLGTTLALKYTVAEKRPNGESHSFPSGHTAFAFSAAEFIRNRYGWEYGLPSYVAASLVAYSRTETRQHYFHDVLAGAVIGAGSSYLFTTSFKSLTVSGQVAPGYYGVIISSNW